MKALKVFSLLLFMSVFTSSTGTWYYTVYAEYLYYMAKHTQHLNQEKSIKFKIGIYGSQSMYNATKQMSLTKRIEQKLIYVEEISSLPNEPELQLIFMGKDKINDLSKVISYCRKHNILLVTDLSGGVAKGADVEFLEDKSGNIKFKINAVACNDRGIKISPVLQNMAMK